MTNVIELRPASPGCAADVSEGGKDTLPFFEAMPENGVWHLYLVTGGRNGDYELLAKFESHRSVDLFFAKLGQAGTRGRS